MTFSILVRDPDSGTIAGAAATGNLCVGGWVLRGDPRAGISASQGMTPSTLWGDAVLDAMRGGVGADVAVEHVVSADSGRAARQLLALDRSGSGAAFTGEDNLPVVSEIIAENCVVGGNMLARSAVTAACQAGFRDSQGPLPQRLLRALEEGAAAGSDVRGLMSAAILVLSAREPPVSLRVDYSAAPLADLARLVERNQAEDYRAWRATLPTHDDPTR